MVINYGHGPAPVVEPIEDEPEAEAGDVLTPGNPESPSLTPQQIARFATEFRRQAESYYYPTWRICTSLVSGWRLFQNVGTQAVPQSVGIAQFMRPRDVSVNIVQPLFRNVVARLSVQQPASIVVPATEATDDIEGARAGEQALRYFWRRAKVSQKLTSAIEWAAMHGTAGLHVLMRNGDVDLEAIPPDRLRAEPGIADPDDSRFLGFTIVTTRDALKAQFPQHAKAIDGAPVPSNPFMPSTTPFGTQMPPDRVEVLQAYCRSGHWFLLVGEGGTVLAQGETPGRCMPLNVVRYTKIPGQFFGMGMVEPCQDVQYAFSTVLNQIFRNARLMSNPKVLIDRNAKVDENAFTTREGEKVLFSNGLRPEPWVPPPLPAYMQNLLPMLQSYSHDVTGIHTTSTGKRAVGVSSGRAIEALTANDLAQLQSTQNELVYATEAFSKCVLQYMKAYYDESKMIRDFDQYGKAMFSVISVTNLAEDPEVFIEADSLFTATVKDKDQKTLDLLRLGIIDAKTAKKMLSFHLDPTAPISDIADMQHAKQMLAVVVQDGYYLTNPDGTPKVDAQGQPVFEPRVQLYPADNFDMFADVVGNFMRSDNFYALPQERQDDVYAFYQDILKKQAFANMPPEEKAAAEQVNSNGNVKGMNRPGTPAAPVEALPGNVDTMEATDAQADTIAAQGGV